MSDDDDDDDGARKERLHSVMEEAGDIIVRFNGMSKRGQ